MNKYYLEGMKSFHKNMGRYENPYERGGQNYNSFERGWTQALKRCSENRLKKYKI